MKIIMKVQMPIATNCEDIEVLIYNETRKFHKMVPVTDELKRLMGSSYKKYFQVKISNPKKENADITFIKEVDNPGW